MWCEISSSHGGEYDVQGCLLGYTACKMIVDRRFRGAYWWRQYAPLKSRSTIILHGSISQKTTLNIILAAVRTWNLTPHGLIRARSRTSAVRGRRLTWTTTQPNNMTYTEVEILCLAHFLDDFEIMLLLWHKTTFRCYICNMRNEMPEYG
jgi:hypothetical protein